MKLSRHQLWMGSLTAATLLAACSGAPPARPTLSSQASSSGEGNGTNSGDSGANTSGTTNNTGSTSTGGAASTQKTSLGNSFKLNALPENDALDYTFGVAAVDFDPGVTDLTLSSSRSLVSDGKLTAAQIASLSPLCRDIGLSSDPSTFTDVTDWKKGQKLYVMWRSYFKADIKQALADAVTAGHSGIQCQLRLSYMSGTSSQTINLQFDPLAANSANLAGSAKLDQAVKAGLLMPQSSNSTAVYDAQKLTAIADAPKMLLKVAPLTADKVPIKANNPAGDQCYYASGSTRVANPYGAETMTFDASGDVAPSDIKDKAISGKMIAQCQTLKPSVNGKSITVNLSCDDYQKIKEQGMEAGCAWDVSFVNPQDDGNSVTVPLQMSKLTYQSIDTSKLDQALKLVPQSPDNPIRKNVVTLQNMNQLQKQALTEMFDLWIALDGDSFRRDFASQVKNLIYKGSTGEYCSTGSGGFTYYNTDTINWCSNGEATDDALNQRFKNPYIPIYLAVTFYHESRHAHDIRHDVERTDYQPCQGTALSASLPYIAQVKCDFDYCKVLRGGTTDEYKQELNYDYNGDNTGRKGQGQCKSWSNDMGVSGGGF